MVQWTRRRAGSRVSSDTPGERAPCNSHTRLERKVCCPAGEANNALVGDDTRVERPAVIGYDTPACGRLLLGRLRSALDQTALWPAGAIRRRSTPVIPIEQSRGVEDGW